MKKFLTFVFILAILIILVFILKSSLQAKKPYYIELELSKISEDKIKIKDIPISLYEEETFPEFILKLYNLKDDKNFKLLILNLTNYNFNWEQTYELRKILRVLKNNREIICYADSYNQKAYFLATSCSKIYIANGSILEIPGFYSELLFYKNLLDSLKIDIFAVQYEEYKSAVEPFINKEPSKYLIEEIENILNYYYEELKNSLKERGIENPDTIINKVGYFYTKDAINYKLVDGVKYPDEFDEFKKGLVKRSLKIKSKFSNKKIAIISAEGTILNNDTYNPFDKSKTIGNNFSKLLQKIRKDKSIVAVLIRLNSPGGSSLMSDIISREIKLLSKEKEVVISMGRVCASGCYYLSSYASKIFSEKLTLTGSIGVFMIKPSYDEFLRKKLYINPYIIKKGEHSDIFSSRKLTDEEKEGLKNFVYKIYQDFINVVSEGRKISQDSVRKIAKGRIYLGLKAKELGLVDTIGGFIDALNYLKSKYKDASIEFYSREIELNLDILGLNLKSEKIFMLEPLFLFNEDIIKP